MTKVAKKITFLLMGLVLALTLSACGKRAAHVDSPDDTKEDTYPFIYPDPATDPPSSK